MQGVGFRDAHGIFVGQAGGVQRDGHGWDCPLLELLPDDGDG